jgi:hypothetical protein
MSVVRAQGVRGVARLVRATPNRVGALLVLLFVSLPMGASGAEPRYGALTVDSQGTGYVDIVFRRATTVDGEHAWVGAGHGSVAFYLQPLGTDTSAATGYALAPDFTVPGSLTGSEPWPSDPLPLTDRDVASAVAGKPRRLPAGRYRLHVVAQEPARVTIPVTGPGAMRVRTTHTGSATLASKDVTATSLVGQQMPAPAVSVADLGLRVPSDHTVTLVAMQIVRHGARLVPSDLSVQLCVEPDTRPHCALEGDDRADVYRDGRAVEKQPSGEFVEADRFTRFYFPGTASERVQGDAEAYSHVVSTTGADRVVVLGLSLAL